MSNEYALLREENGILHSHIDSLKQERDEAYQRISRLEETIRSQNSHIKQIEGELENSISETIQVYNILHSTNPSKETDAVIVNLKTENKQLKEVIATLYLKYKAENEGLQRKLSALEEDYHSQENKSRSELSELCGEYKTEIELLRKQLDNSQSKEQVNSIIDTEELERLQNENRQHQELHQLDQQLIDEYSILLEKQAKDLEEKEKMIKKLAQSLYQLNEDYQKKEIQLDRYLQKIHHYQEQLDISHVQSIETGNYQSFSQLQAQLDTKTQECEELQKQLTLKDLEKSNQTWLYSQVIQCIPSSSMKYVEECSDLSALQLLTQLSSYLLNHSLSQFKQHQFSLSLPLFSGYFRCLLYLSQIVDVSTQFLLLVNNPYLSAGTFSQLVSDSHSHVQSFLQFCYDFKSWENDMITENNSWNISQEVIHSIAILKRFLSEEGHKGDCIWQRNIGCVAAMDKCMEIQVQLYLMHYLLQSQSQILKEQDGVNEQIITGMTSLLSIFNSCVNSIDLLWKKVSDLHQQITDDHFVGIPSLCIDGSNEQLIEKSQLQCIDHSSLWNNIELLKQECTEVSKLCNRFALPQKSIITQYISNMEDMKIYESVLRECSDDSLTDKKSLYYRVSHFYHNLKVVSSDSFCTGINNPSQQVPEESSTLLHNEGLALKEQYDVTVSESTQKKIDELEKKSQEAIEKMSVLERTVIDLTAAREQLVTQLNSRKEAIDVRLSTTLNETEKLSTALKKKKKECDDLTKETEQLKKEMQDLRNQLDNKNTHSLTSNQLILKRSFQNLKQLSIRNQLAQLPTCQFPEEQKKAVSLPLSVGTTMMKEVLQVKVVDVSSLTPSVYKEQEKINQYFDRLVSTMKEKEKLKGKLDKPTSSSVFVSSVTLPSHLLSPVLSTGTNSLEVVVSNSTLQSIHSSIIE